MASKKPLCSLIFLALFWISPSVAEAGSFGLHAGTHIGLGSLGSADDKMIPHRTMDSWNFEVMPGYRDGFFLGGMMFDYDMVGQVTSRETAGNTLGGTQFLIGVGIALEPGPWKFLVSYDFIGQYSVSSANTGGTNEDFQTPSGFHFLFGYTFAPHWYWDMEFTNWHYSSIERGGASADVSTNPVKRWNLAFGLSLSY